MCKVVLVDKLTPIKNLNSINQTDKGKIILYLCTLFIAKIYISIRNRAFEMWRLKSKVLFFCLIKKSKGNIERIYKQYIENLICIERTYEQYIDNIWRNKKENILTEVLHNNISSFLFSHFLLIQSKKSSSGISEQSLKWRHTL